MTNYWVVGAWWGGVNDRTADFIKKGYWENGWGSEKLRFLKLTNQIRQGDRIAIKKRTSNTKLIEIRALGIVTGTAAKRHRIAVKWVKTGLHHKTAIHGCVGTISGPFPSSNDWVRQVFLLGQFEHVLGPDDLLDVDDGKGLSPEGGRKLRVHLRIERKPRNAKRKKQQVMEEKNGLLECEVCCFNFANEYGKYGDGFCEVHHKTPLSEVDEPVSPNLDDLAIVCSNCHRMIHKTEPMMSIEDFRDFKARLGAK